MLSHAELSVVVDTLLEGLQVLSPDWRYLHINERAATQGRSTPEALIGRSILDCYPGIEKTAVFAQMQRCMTLREAVALETEFRFPDGSLGWFELRMQPVPLGICILSLDVTARRQAEAAQQQSERRLAETQRLESIGRLAATAAHDFNNYLTLILNIADGAAVRTDGEVRADLQAIVDLTRSSAGLTRELLTCGASAPLEPERIDLADYVARRERLVRSGVPSTVRLTMSLAPAAVHIDPQRFERVMVNLVKNAVEAMPEGGELRVRVDTLELGEHAVLSPGRYAELCIADDGRGMDEQERAHLFDPCPTRDVRAGRGFGLISVAGIVRQHGGHIDVTSSPGNGSTFCVLLPLAETGSQIDRATPVQLPVRAPQRRAERTILVVDDTPEIGRLVQRHLQAARHRVLLAASGEEALALWDQHRDEVDLLLTDLVLPGVSGTELIQQLRSSRPDLPTLCMSGNLPPEPHGGGIAFLEKPFTGQELRERVRSMLDD